MVDRRLQRRPPVRSRGPFQESARWRQSSPNPNNVDGHLGLVDLARLDVPDLVLLDQFAEPDVARAVVDAAPPAKEDVVGADDADARAGAHHAGGGACRGIDGTSGGSGGGKGASGSASGGTSGGARIWGSCNCGE